MPNKTNIEWTDYTSNPIQAYNRETEKRGWFCEIVSPGCGHCYSQTLNTGRFGNGLKFLPSNADKVEFRLNTDELRKIRNLSKLLGSRGQKKFLFPFDMTDLFLRHHPDEYLDQFFATVALSPNLIFQVLTKRADRMLEYMTKIADPGYWGPTISEYEFEFSRGEGLKQSKGLPPFTNLWLGISAEDQERADERIPLLLQTPAAKRFLSAEPLLGPVNFAFRTPAGWYRNALEKGVLSSIDLVIVGGESGPHARPCDLAWIRSIVDQCRSAGVAAFCKQLGSSHRCEHSSKGGCVACFPEDLRVREMPEVE